MSTIAIGSAVMKNVGRINRYLIAQDRAGVAEEVPQRETRTAQKTLSFPFLPFWGLSYESACGGRAAFGQLWLVNPGVLSVES